MLSCLLLLCACIQQLSERSQVVPEAVDWGTLAWDDLAVDPVVIGIMNLGDGPFDVADVRVGGTGTAGISLAYDASITSLEPGETFTVTVSLLPSTVDREVSALLLVGTVAAVPLTAAVVCDLDADGYEALPCGGSDCDDHDALSRPGGLEWCNGLDDDCDGDVDEQGADGTGWYPDLDADGYGAGAPTVSCDDPGDGRVDNGTDCDDDDPTIHPLAPESCDGVDHDCDGLVDEPDSTDATAWYADLDADGLGTGDPTLSCTDPGGLTSTPGDCDDTDASVGPVGRPEVCDGVDNDCDGVVDDDATDAVAYCTDADGDGHGDPATLVLTCAPPAGAVTDCTDCDDARPSTGGC